MPVALKIIFMNIDNPIQGEIDAEIILIRFCLDNLFLSLSLKNSAMAKNERKIPKGLPIWWYLEKHK